MGSLLSRCLKARSGEKPQERPPAVTCQYREAKIDGRRPTSQERERGGQGQSGGFPGRQSLNGSRGEGPGLAREKGAKTPAHYALCCPSTEQADPCFLQPPLIQPPHLQPMASLFQAPPPALPESLCPPGPLLFPYCPSASPPVERRVVTGTQKQDLGRQKFPEILAPVVCGFFSQLSTALPWEVGAWLPVSSGGTRPFPRGLFSSTSSFWFTLGVQVWAIPGIPTLTGSFTSQGASEGVSSLSGPSFYQERSS